MDFEVAAFNFNAFIAVGFHLGSGAVARRSLLSCSAGTGGSAAISSKALGPNDSRGFAVRPCFSDFESSFTTGSAGGAGGAGAACRGMGGGRWVEGKGLFSRASGSVESVGSGSAGSVANAIGTSLGTNEVDV